MTTTVLEIRGDSSSLQRAAKQAGTALDETGRKAERMAAQAKVGGNNLSAAFGATGGGIAVTRGLVSIGDGFKSANSGMALFAASQALLDVGRLSNDMGAVASATGATGGAFSKLGAIIKANPLLTIAAVIAGAATAMGLFGDETKEAANAFDKLAEAQRKARLSEETKAFLGISTLSARGQQLKGVEDLVEQLGGSNPQRQTLGSIARFTDTPIDAVRRAQLATGGVTDFSPQRLRSVITGGSAGSRLGVNTRLELEDIPLSEQEVSPEVARNILRAIYRDLLDSVEKQSASERGGSGASGAAGSVSAAATPGDITAYYGDPYGPTRPGELYGPEFGFTQSREANANLEFDRQQEESAQLARQNMDELIRQGQQFGATIGDAFFSAASGAADLRQIVAQIVSDMARAGARQGFSQLFGAVSGSFGQTGAQAAGNTTAPVPGQG